MSFVGYACWSSVVSFSNADSFRETLQKDGFTIIQATDISFLWLPPPTSISCQSQTQFINEARSLNTTYGRLLGGNFIYQLDVFHFYAVTPDTSFAYEYTSPHPIFLDPLTSLFLDPLVLLLFFLFIVFPIIFIFAVSALLIAQIIGKRRTRSAR
jgi:hypothetical protein